MDIVKSKSYKIRNTLSRNYYVNILNNIHNNTIQIYVGICI